MGGTINRLSVMRLAFIAMLCALAALSPVGAPLRVSPPAAALQPGAVVLLTIESDEPAPALRVRAFDRELAPFALDGRRWQVLVGIDLT
jgi:hypothetical protein